MILYLPIKKSPHHVITKHGMSGLKKVLSSNGRVSISANYFSWLLYIIRVFIYDFGWMTKMKTFHSDQKKKKDEDISRSMS